MVAGSVGYTRSARFVEIFNQALSPDYRLRFRLPYFPLNFPDSPLPIGKRDYT